MVCHVTKWGVPEMKWSKPAVFFYFWQSCDVMVGNITFYILTWLLSTFVVSGGRSTAFIVGVTFMSPAIMPPTLLNYDRCERYPGWVGDGITVYLHCLFIMPPRRYLIVHLQATGTVLNFCELEVYGYSKLNHIHICLSYRI